MINNEEWKCYKFDQGFDDDYKLYFNKYGEVLSVNKINPEGKLLKGSLREGYPIISFSKLKPTDEKSQNTISEQESEITEIRSQLKELKKIVRRKKTEFNISKKAERQIISLENTLKIQLDKLSKLRKKDAKKRRVYYHLLVHKAVAELFLPNDDPENKKFVIHKNFNKQDNRLENLAWATKKEVVDRSFKSPNYISFKINKTKKDPTIASKLTRNDVVLIKRKLEKGEPMARLARRFGVSDMQIYRIKTGENWGDVKLSLSK